MVNFSNCVPDHYNYITFKNTDVSTQTYLQNINNIQASTASSNHREKENGKNCKKLNISQLNSKTCDKTHVNKNSNNNIKESEPLDQVAKKSETEEIIEQSNLNTMHKKRPCTIIVGDSTVKYLHGKSIANKTSRATCELPETASSRKWLYKNYVINSCEAISGSSH